MARRAEALAPGFTLIELVMVILILGIISVTLLPKFFSSASLDERGYYEDLLQSLRYAREVSLARGCRVQAVIFSNDFYFMQDADCDSSSYSRTTYTQPLMRPDQSQRLEYLQFDQDGHDPIALANQILVIDPAGEILQDNAGSLVGIATLTLSVGSRSFTVHGDTAYVQ